MTVWNQLTYNYYYYYKQSCCCSNLSANFHLTLNHPCGITYSAYLCRKDLGPWEMKTWVLGAPCKLFSTDPGLSYTERLIQWNQPFSFSQKKCCFWTLPINKMSNKTFLDNIPFSCHSDNTVSNLFQEQAMFGISCRVGVSLRFETVSLY